MRLKIGARVYLIGLAAFLGLVVMLGLSLARLNTTMRDDIADRTKTTVETAYSVLAYYQAEEAAGRMSRQQAQGAALNAVRSMRYNGNEYFWINDMTPRMLMHPMKPELIGQDVSQITDPNGTAIFRVMVETVRNHGEGFVDYSWPKPGKSEPQPKVSYVKGFRPWGWVIGSGVYADDVRAAVWNAAMHQVLIAFFVIAAVMGLAFFLGRTITRPLVAITGRMRSLVDGDRQTHIPGLSRHDEIGEMAGALEIFRDAAVAKDAAETAKAQADAEQQFVVDTLSERLASLSDGDLTAEIREAFPDVYETLKGNYNTAVVNLRDLIGTLSEAAVAIRTGSSEIAQASEDLARRTEANAASLEETSAALNQMDDRLRTSAAASERTVEQTNAAIAIVGEGRSTADDAVAAMNRVSESAQGIDSVIEGLDKIAFQTRVLAMNAAVEAGRAGEAGRGFAVVADLVSALAMRSEEEAKRAREQLTATQTDIGAAVGAVRNVDGALANISGSVEQVHGLVTSMAEDNRAQSATIGEIVSAVGTMDTSTQQNAAMVEETSAAARNLSSEVNRLAEHAARFRTGPERGGAARGAGRRDNVPSLPAALAGGSTSAVSTGDWASF